MSDVEIGEAVEGLRERKRRETRKRITEAGVRLFIEKGYDATTVDEIAAAAGISRRTFFHYFPAKDDVLQSLQSGMGSQIAAKVRHAATGARPLEVVRDAVIEVCGQFRGDEMMAIDRVMRSSPAVQARKQANYVENEQILFNALRDRWPQPQRESALRVVAMLSVGAIRISLERFAMEEGRGSLAEMVRQTFDTLQNEL